VTASASGSAFRGRSNACATSTRPPPRARDTQRTRERVADMRCDRLGVRQRLFGETKRVRDVDAAAPRARDTQRARSGTRRPGGAPQINAPPTSRVDDRRSPNGRLASARATTWPTRSERRLLAGSQRRLRSDAPTADARDRVAGPHGSTSHGTARRVRVASVQPIREFARRTDRGGASAGGPPEARLAANGRRALGLRAGRARAPRPRFT